MNSRLYVKTDTASYIWYMNQTQCQHGLINHPGWFFTLCFTRVLRWLPLTGWGVKHPGLFALGSGGGGPLSFPTLTVTACDRGKHGVPANESMSSTRSRGAYYGKNTHCDTDVNFPMWQNTFAGLPLIEWSNSVSRWTPCPKLRGNNVGARKTCKSLVATTVSTDQRQKWRPTGGRSDVKRGSRLCDGDWRCDIPSSPGGTRV